MTFPIRPVSPLSVTQHSMRAREDPELAAAAMQEKPTEATSLLSELLHRIGNAGTPTGAGYSAGVAMEASAHISRFVERAAIGPPPSKKSFARQLVYVGEVEKDLREQLGAATTDEKRWALGSALRVLVELKRFHNEPDK